MLRRFLLILVTLAGTASLPAQDAASPSAGVAEPAANLGKYGASAWLDLRQRDTTSTGVQSAPAWVESVTLVPPEAGKEGEPKSVFRIHLAQPAGKFQWILARLFFDDVAYARPELVAWDETGGQILRSGLLGSGVNLPSSDGAIIPALGASAIDIEVPGDGSTIRGIYFDWMSSTEVAQPSSVEHSDMIAMPFSAAPVLRATEQDDERFGTVTATLAADVVAMGTKPEESAGFQFPLEAQPLMALLVFEIASPSIDSPPHVIVNGTNIGAAALVLPDLADPGYRGKSQKLVPQMQFQYTGWVRAQVVIPTEALTAGDNNLFIMNTGASASAVRSTQLQLKYLWEKSDYILKP